MTLWPYDESNLHRHAWSSRSSSGKHGPDGYVEDWRMERCRNCGDYRVVWPGGVAQKDREWTVDD